MAPASAKAIADSIEGYAGDEYQDRAELTEVGGLQIRIGFTDSELRRKQFRR